jgi:hypothetical protein
MQNYSAVRAISRTEAPFEIARKQFGTKADDQHNAPKRAAVRAEMRTHEGVKTIPWLKRENTLFRNFQVILRANHSAARDATACDRRALTKGNRITKNFGKGR